jgi:Phosphotransferase enzyme family
MAKSTLPAVVDDLTPEWLTQALREEGTAGEAAVTGVEREVIGTGIGFVGVIVRLRLTWDRDDPSRPATMIAKLPTQNTLNRALAEGLLAYEREIRMYAEFGDPGIRRPVCYLARCDPNPVQWLSKGLEWVLERLPVWLLVRMQPFWLWLFSKSTRRYVLLLEDVADAAPPSQIVGGGVDQVRVGLTLLARLHARHWRDPGLDARREWLWPLDRMPRVVQAAYRRRRDEFAAAAPSAVESGLMDELDRVQEDYPDLVRAFMTAPSTLLHGDFRLDNLLFRPDGEVVVVDWQLCGVGPAAWDVSYFITGALEPSVGRAHEKELLDHYLTELRAGGVPEVELTLDELTDQCDLVKRLMGHRMVLAEELLDTDLGDGQSFVELMSRRMEGWLAA